MLSTTHKYSWGKFKYYATLYLPGKAHFENAVKGKINKFGVAATKMGLRA